jgi:hypothetical protein
MTADKQAIAHLYRFFNGREVSFDIPKLLREFEPFHDGWDRETGKVLLRFPGYNDDYEFRFSRETVQMNVTLTVSIRLPVHAPGFWFCVYCALSADNVLLAAPTPPGFWFAKAGALDHLPKDWKDVRPHCMHATAPHALIEIFAK